MSEVRVLLVDDQAIVRRGLRAVLDGESGLCVVGEAVDGLEAVSAASRLRPDVVLMDVRMPRLDGVAATRRILAADQAPAPAVLVLTTFDDDEYLFGALRASASGYLLKDADPDQIVAGVRAAAAGDAVLAASVTRRLIAAAVAGGEPAAARRPQREALEAALTPRERQTLLGLAQGWSNARLAAQIHLSEPTVKTHVSHLLTKLGLRSRVQAVVLAYEIGIVVPGQLPLERLSDPDAP